MLNCKSSSRNQRPKGFKVKPALQLALLLAACIWLLYQMKNSHVETKNTGRSTSTNLREGHSHIHFGRKGISGWSTDGGDSNFPYIQLMGEKKEKANGVPENDELDGNSKENTQELGLKENENAGMHEGKEDRIEVESEFKEMQIHEDRVVILDQDSFSRVHENELGSFTDHDKRTGHKGSEKIVNASRSSGRDFNIKLRVAAESNGDDEAFALQNGGMAITSSSGQYDMDNVHSFQDVNGVPLEVNDFIDPEKSESSNVQNSSHFQETVSSSNNQNRITESMLSERVNTEYKRASLIENDNVIDDLKIRSDDR